VYEVLIGSTVVYGAKLYYGFDYYAYYTGYCPNETFIPGFY